MIKLNKLIKDKDGNVSEIWSKTISVNKEDIRTYSEANLRTQYEDEIIFDAESKREAEIVKGLLLTRGWNFIEWDTGSRGKHFHCILKGFDNIPKEEREIYRWIVLNRDNYLNHLKTSCERYGDMTRYDTASKLIGSYPTFFTDDCLRNENHFIAMENRPHLKSNKVKSLVYSSENIYNKIDMELVISIRKIYKDRELTNNKQKIISADSVSDLNEIKLKIKVSDLFKKWGYFNDGKNRHNPFWRKSSSDASVQINDKNNNCFDYGEYKGYGLFTLVMMKHNCTFAEAVNLLKNNKY